MEKEKKMPKGAQAESDGATESAGFDPESIAALAADPAFDIAEQTAAELAEAAQERTPKTGNKTKTAREAEKALEMHGVLLPMLNGLNAVVANMAPEFRHSEKEIQTLSILGGKVLSKYVDTALSKYGDEIVLLAFLGGSLTQKGYAYYGRLQREAAYPHESKNGKNDNG